VYPGAPHAMISTSKRQVNEDLLEFVKVGRDQNQGGSKSLPVQRLSRVEAELSRNHDEDQRDGTIIVSGGE